MSVAGIIFMRISATAAQNGIAQTVQPNKIIKKKKRHICGTTVPVLVYISMIAIISTTPASILAYDIFIFSVVASNYENK